MSAVIRSADETRALSSRIHSLQLSNHLDDTHATLSATALQLCSVDRTRAVTLTHTYIIPDHTVNDRTWFRAMVTRTCSVQSALQHACRVLFLVHVQHVFCDKRSDLHVPTAGPRRLLHSVSFLYFLTNTHVVSHGRSRHGRRSLHKSSILNYVMKGAA